MLCLLVYTEKLFVSDMSDSSSDSDEEFSNVDSYLDNDGEQRDAAMRWVRVANGTEKTFKVVQSIDRARRQQAQLEARGQLVRS